VRSITAGYDGSTALDDVSIEIRDGELVGLLGANNAGKSTLINCLSGIVKPRAGSIHFEGEDISGLAPHEV
ncbi:ATP-binding cassette domain-containing protein, partial [Acinetobacter pittii]|uniref:ATP-binding cassette domain-containing protein n=1 Tax=Acinetobacter pittii TaxID=48296 RepID=UPI001BDBA91C